ncbi:MAG: GAF domain-containing protein [Salinivirgaceae bacterium]|nr:GAF domain-containing protein [Salinivirgaceae bacterium]
MIFKKTIHRKMVLNLLGTSLIMYIAAMGYIIYEVAENLKADSYTEMKQESHDITSRIEGLVASRTKIVETLAATMANYNDIEETERRPFFSDLLHQTLLENPDLCAAWSIWEPNSIDNLDENYIDKVNSNSIGSFSPSFYRVDEEIKSEETTDTQYEEDFYTLPRDTKKTKMVEPYFYSYNGKDSILMTSIVAPIIVWDEFMGVVGIDLSIHDLKKLLVLNPDGKDEKNYLISESGKYLYSRDTKLTDTKQTIVADIDSIARDTLYIGNDINGEKSIIVCNKACFDNAQSYWHVVTVSSWKSSFKQRSSSLLRLLIITIIGLIIISIVISIVARTISGTIVGINNKLADLSLGVISDKKMHKTRIKSEITDLTESIEVLSDGLKASVNFAGEIGKGNYDAQYRLLSNEDTLGESLIAMQKSLVKAKEEEDQKKEFDAQRNWVTHGLAEFGEIIRQENENADSFAYNVLNELLKYMNIVQGAVYFKIEDEYDTELKFESKAAIAYGKQIMLDTVVTAKDGLFGRVIDEMRLIYLEDVPDSFVTFTQGKREEQKPRNLLLAPMIVNDEIYGIMELISYNHIEKYKIDFVEHLCENMASAVSNVSINAHNAKLLEQSNEQTEVLSQHEEEMRQNLEEMQATQEEATKRQDQLNAQISAYYKGLMVAEIDLSGKIISMSKRLMFFYNVGDTFIGVPYVSLVTQDEVAREQFINEFWPALLNTGKAQRKNKSLIRGKQLRTTEYYKVVYLNEQPDHVIVVSENRNREHELKDRLMLEIQSYMKEHGIDTGNA